MSNQNSKKISKREEARLQAIEELKSQDLKLDPKSEKEYIAFVTERNLKEKDIISNSIAVELKKLRELNIISPTAPVNQLMLERVFQAGMTYMNDVSGHYNRFFMEDKINRFVERAQKEVESETKEPVG